ncbi:hypothetical protein [Streptococcus devriesei]|uniref:hypothetical protein n=1 Tax=Streptococcus devriesei TaxID=231233 RepID=UPI0004299199|nr:hypothetical protein [Streptococcus devriesei]
MLKYFRKNSKVLLLLVALIVVSGPLFSIILSSISSLLNTNLGDWLSFYGAMTGIVISLVVIHFQLYLENEKNLKGQRPKLFLEYDYQDIKPGCPIYYQDKYWFGLIHRKENSKKLAVRSFKNFYSEEGKMDKALSFEIQNNRPVFDLQIQFGNQGSYVAIPKLSEDQKIYVVSKEHQDAIFAYLSKNNKNAKETFTHVPPLLKIYYTTTADEKIYQEYSVDANGYCELVKEKYDVNYPSLSGKDYICDYFVR